MATSADLSGAVDSAAAAWPARARRSLVVGRIVPAALNPRSPRANTLQTGGVTPRNLERRAVRRDAATMLAPQDRPPGHWKLPHT